ncbi:hypothetical protein HOP50_18g81270 [Chloropicon primus]|nr:hypothetical protein HOP50_18g81270 [Chloropicon primus]
MAHEATGEVLPGLSPLSPSHTPLPLSPSSVQVLDEATTNVERRIEEFDRYTPVKAGGKEARERGGDAREGSNPAKVLPLSQIGTEQRRPLHNRTNLSKETGKKARQLQLSLEKVKHSSTARGASTPRAQRQKSLQGDRVKAGATRQTERSLTSTSGARGVVRAGGHRDEAEEQQQQQQRVSGPPPDRRSPILIDLATPLPPQAQGTPEWARELSFAQQQQQLDEAIASCDNPESEEEEVVPQTSAAKGNSDLLADVMVLLDEKTQECRKLYTIMKQLDQASKAGSGVQSETSDLLRATPLAPSTSGPNETSIGRASGPRQGKQQDLSQDRRKPDPLVSLSASPSLGENAQATSCGTQTPPRSKQGRVNSSKDEFISKLEDLLLEAKGSRFSATDQDDARFLQLEEVKRENLELHRANQELVERCERLEHELRDCLEAVRKADQLILKVMSQQQSRKFRGER